MTPGRPAVDSSVTFLVGDKQDKLVGEDSHRIDHYVSIVIDIVGVRQLWSNRTSTAGMVVECTRIYDCAGRQRTSSYWL